MLALVGKQIQIIGAPTDVGASRTGCRLGPGALRVARLGPALEGFGYQVYDAGDVTGPPNPELPPVGGYRHLAEVAAWNTAVRDAVREALDAGRLPIMVGGDHCLAIGSISAAAAWCRTVGKQLRVLWVDAHADFNTWEGTPTGNIHGMPVACLTGEGPAELIGLSDQVPAIEPSQVRQVGLRSVDQQEKQRLVDRGVQVYDMRRIDEVGMRAVIEDALTGTGPDTHLHLSLDLDFVDPAMAPGVGTPVIGGPTYREAQLVMELVADTGLLGSLDLVELNPALDVRNTTAELAVDLVESMFGKSTLLRF